MTSYNNIEKYQYMKIQSDKVSLNEYLFVTDENKKKYLILKMQNKMNQMLYKISLEILQYNEDNFLLSKSVINYEDVIEANSEFIPKAKLLLLSDCTKIEYNLVYAKFETIEFKDNQISPIPFTIEDFKAISKKENREINNVELNKNNSKKKEKVVKEKRRKNKKTAKRVLTVTDCTSANKSAFSKVFQAILSIICLVVAASFIFIFQYTSDEVYNGVFQYEIRSSNTDPDNSDTEYVYITGINSELTEVEIPETIDGKVVVSIKANAFSYSKVEKVTILQDGLVISDKAFKNARNLKEIHQGPNVKVIRIGKYAFKNCYNLEVFDIPACKSIDTGTFENCKSLTELNLPNAVLKEYSLTGCNKLNSLTYASTLAGSNFYKLFANKVNAVPKSLRSVTTNQSVIKSSYFGDSPSITSLTLLNPFCDVKYGAFKGLSLPNYIYTDLFEEYQGELTINPNIDINQIVINNDINSNYISKFIQKLLVLNPYLRELTIDYTKSAIDFDFEFNDLRILNVSHQTKFTNDSFMNCYGLDEIEVFKSEYTDLDTIVCLDNIVSSSASILKINVDNCAFNSSNSLKGLYNLYEINLPETMKLTANIFKYQYNLQTINMPFTNFTLGQLGISQSVSVVKLSKAQASKISSGYLNGYHNIDEIEFPEGITNVASYAINNAANLNRLILPKSIIEMGLPVIDNCNNLSYIVTPFVSSTPNGNSSYRSWNTSCGATRYLTITTLITGGSNFSIGLEHDIHAISFKEGVKDSLDLLKHCRYIYALEFNNQDSLSSLGSDGIGIIILNKLKNIKIDTIKCTNYYLSKDCDLKSFDFKYAETNGFYITFEGDKPSEYNGNYQSNRKITIDEYM